MNNLQQVQNKTDQGQTAFQQNYPQAPAQQFSPQQPPPMNSLPNAPGLPQASGTPPAPSSDRAAAPAIQPSAQNAEQIANLLGSLAASMPAPRNLVDAKTAYLTYQPNYDRVISDFPKKLREWGRWTIVDSPEQADILLHLSQGRLNMFSNEIVVQVYDRAQRNIATVSCERRISGTGSVLVNRLKKEIEKQANSKGK